MNLFRHPMRRAGQLVLAGITALTLAACVVQPAEPIVSPGAPAAGPTRIPTTGTTSVPTTAPSTIPTTMPSVAPSTTPTRPSDALVGPEWTVALQGDFDGNGRQDVIAFKPSSVRSSVNPGTVSFAAVVSEAVLVERKTDGSPWVRVLGDLGGLSIDGARVIAHTDSRPTAYLLALINDRRQFLLYPLDAQGQQTNYPIGAAYDQATSSYNRLGGEIPGGQPLLGAEWTVITSGDFDRNGRSDMIGYKPANVTSGVSTSGGYLASEVVVAERGPSGAPVVRLLITRDGVLADNLSAASFGSGDNRPAGFIARLQGAERKLVLTPLNCAGEQYAQDVAISYVDVVGRYVVAGPGGVLPLPLVGPEWTVALNGSFTPGVSDGVIAYKPANTPVGYTPPFDFFAVSASAFVLVDRAANGGAAVRLSADLDAIAADGQPLVRLSQNGARPSALLVRGSADRSVLFTLLNRDGMPFGSEFKVYWDSGALAYRVTNLGPGGYQPPPPVEPQTPVGFTELSRGDLNSDGLPDLVAYVPSELVLASGEVVAKELGIFVAGGNGTEAQASLLNGAIYAGGYLIYAFGDGSGSPLPAAYTVVFGGGGLILTPLAADGTVTGRSVLLAWNLATGAYAATPR